MSKQPMINPTNGALSANENCNCISHCVRKSVRDGFGGNKGCE